MSEEQDAFRTLVRTEGARLYRDLPWRRTRDPYAVWVSEVMLQQTQVPRVLARWDAWLERFPTVEALAAAEQAEVLARWQGMGYNRRALALKAAAEMIVRDHGGAVPRQTDELTALPGIGPATAQGIRSFAFDLPGVYLETNVRAVFLHHLFPDAQDVPDRELVALVEAACPCGAGGPPGRFAVPQDGDDTPRTWYFALLDYGAHLKKTLPNPSRRSRTHTRQARFEGSRRQKRAELVRILLAARAESLDGLDAGQVAARLDEVELAAGRSAVERGLVESLLADLAAEGFCTCEAGSWKIA